MRIQNSNEKQHRKAFPPIFSNQLGVVRFCRIGETRLLRLFYTFPHKETNNFNYISYCIVLNIVGRLLCVYVWHQLPTLWTSFYTLLGMGHIFIFNLKIMKHFCLVAAPSIHLKLFSFPDLLFSMGSKLCYRIK